MRAEIRALQKSLGITAIYVTHDQEEAMSVSDRIALMNAGRLEQVGVPVDIYRHPVSRFAAEFMGTTNLLAAGALGRSDGALVSLRPEALRFAADAPAGWPVLSGSVVRVELLGPIVRLDLRLGDGTILKAALLDAPEYQVQAGAAVKRAYDPTRLTVLP
jgi:ABC-type Fe3+/spermidine/putrescine transport system ATPase subunit